MNRSDEPRSSHAQRSPKTVRRSGQPVNRDTTAEDIVRRSRPAAPQTVQEPTPAPSVPPLQPQPTQTQQTYRQGTPSDNRASRQPDRAVGYTANRTPTRYASGTGSRSLEKTDRQLTREERRQLRKERSVEQYRRFVEGHRDKWRKEEKQEAQWQRGIVRVHGGVDRPLLILVILLLFLGTIAVFSSSYPLAVRNGDSTYFYIKKQLGFVLAGVVAMLIGYALPLEKQGWRRFVTIGAYLGAAGLLVAVIFIGFSEGEAQRWVRIPGIPVNIQPSEVMKLALVLTLALYADVFRKKREEADSLGGKYLYNVLIPTAILGVSCGLVLIGKHLSGTMIIGLIGFSMIFVMCDRKTPRWWVFLTIGALLVAAAVVFIVFVPYATERFQGILKAGSDTQNSNWQSTQSLYAVGSGGLFGVGLGGSRQKYSYLAASHTDFIFAIWCEEWGFVGAVFLIICFLVFLWRGFRIASRARDPFAMLTAYGITVHLAIQIIGHMAVDTSFVNTGISLPFFSYGGSSLIMQMVEVGMLMRISTHDYRTEAQLMREELRVEAGLE